MLEDAALPVTGTGHRAVDSAVAKSEDRQEAALKAKVLAERSMPEARHRMPGAYREPLEERLTGDKYLAPKREKTLDRG